MPPFDDCGFCPKCARLRKLAPKLLAALEVIRNQADNTPPYDDELKASITSIGDLARAAIEEANK